jgi:hypothetical protein
MATVTPQDIAEVAQYVRATLAEEWRSVLDAEQEVENEV